MEVMFIIVAVSIFIFGLVLGLAIDAMCVRTRKKPMPMLGVVLPPEEKK